MVSVSDLLRTWFSSDNLSSTLGYLVAILCGIFVLTELYTIITQKSEPDLLMLLMAVVVGGVIQGFTKDVLLAILAGLCWVMIYSLWNIRESPVWRELMISSLISYLVVLAGRTIYVVMKMWSDFKGYNFETYTKFGLNGSQWFGISWNIFIYVFFILCIIFFGRRFFLVSRLTSPQIIYLLLFALSYVVLYQFTRNQNLTFYFGNIDHDIADRILFVSFGTYEIMILANLFLYIISGPLLHLIFGVKKVKDERIINLVEEVRQKLGIKSKVRVGKVKAPILNAFAYGAFFDKRIVFMSKDLNDFTDDDIKGIASHELVHSQKLHTFWLLIISIITFGITKAIKFPATTFDYIFNPDVGLDFLWYYLYNLVLLVFSYLFVRFLEGRADKITLDAGFGESLAKSLVRLDGFYQGIASEMGLSVYLLTNKEQTPSEKLRFLGDAGRNMYRNYIQPSISENFINLIASHPKTAYRVVALTQPKKLKPFKAAILPFLLLVPFIRRKYISELQNVRSDVTPIIDETFRDSYSKIGIQDYDKLSHISYQYKYFEEKNVIAISKIDKKNFIHGKVSKTSFSEKITSPLILELKTSEGKKNIPVIDYDIYEFAIGQKQVFKNGKIGTILELNTKNEKPVFKVKFIKNNIEEIRELITLGVSLDYFRNLLNKDIFFAQKSYTRLAHLDSLEINENNFGASIFTITIGKQTKLIPASKFIISFKPFDIYLKKGKEELQKPIIESLKGKPVSIQTKDDLDTLLKGKITSVKDDSLIVQTLDQEVETKIKRIEFLYCYDDSILLTYKPSLSLIDLLSMKLQNRGKLAYIYP